MSVRTHTSSVFPFSARPNLIFRHLSLIYHYHSSRCYQSYQRHSYFRPKQLFYRSHSHSNVNRSKLGFGFSNFRGQGVRGGSQSGTPKREPLVGTEREGQRGRDELNPFKGFLRKEKEKPLPTESYLKQSLEPSLPLTDPTASRKLLVLDLNGTILLRGPYSVVRPPPLPYPECTSRPKPLPSPRAIYQRPYLSSFRDYIFHPTTRQWLDTMIWSSAQSHSVNDMVHKCFGTNRRIFKAIWSRGTLGLNNDEYHTNTLSIKDLAKPWELISPSLISNRSEKPNPEVDAHGDNHPPVPQQQQQHSAFTTILMDDSPLKAALQPWNHLCVSEYVSDRRELEVNLAEMKRIRRQLAELRKRPSFETYLNTGQHASAKLNEELQTMKEEHNLLHKHILLSHLTTEARLKFQQKEVAGGGEEEEIYDETLLAVIGVLDALKHEGNVAGWIRSGGLVNVGDHHETISATPETDMTTTTTPLSTPIYTKVKPVSSEGEDLYQDLYPGIDWKTTPHLKLEDLASMIPATSGFSNDERTRKLEDLDTKKMEAPMKMTDEERLSPIPRPSSPLPPSPPPSPSSSPLRPAQAEQTSSFKPRGLLSDDANLDPAAIAKSGSINDAWSLELDSESKLKVLMEKTNKKSHDKDSESIPTPLPPKPEEPQSQVERPLLWYEKRSVLSHWVKRGREVLAELGIEEVVHGTMPPLKQYMNMDEKKG